MQTSSNTLSQAQPFVFKKRERYLNILYWIFTILPLITAASFYGLVLFARISMGHWPFAYDSTPITPSPWNFLAVIFSYITYFTSLPSLCSPIVWLILTFLGIKRSVFSRRKILIHTICFSIGLILFMTIIMNAGGFTDWIAD
jgi:hypothetical protein